MSTTNNAYLPLLQTKTAFTTRIPKIIGIYGVSGCGKSYLLEQLKGHFDEKSFFFYEGSERLVKAFQNTLDSFKCLPIHAQETIRARAIEGISRECAKAGKAGIVIGHYSFCRKPTNTIPGDPSTEIEHEVVMTDADKKAYTHILYLKPSPETIVEQVAKDESRQRQHLNAATIRQWQDFEEE